MRLGRVLRASAQHRDALATYTRMAALGSARVAGLPAELLARAARLQVLSAIRDRGTARVEARALLDDLAQARWAVTRGQYEFYRDAAAAVAGVEATASPSDIAVAQAVGDLWNDWRSALSPAGRRSVRAGDATLLVTWRADDDRVAAWVVPPDQLLRLAARDSAFATAFSDHDGTRVAGALGGDGREALRMPADTRLPWVIHVRRADGYVAESRLTRGRLTVLGILVMSVFLAIGVYFIGRAVRREMELARLHADFVSAVSHEFRTPLAAMRQLSEVLAAGRVPDQERREQYYEALASESRRLQHLVENLLDFGRLQAGGAVYRFEPLEPRALVVRVVDEFRGQAPHGSCRVDIADAAECGRVLADPDAIGLALYNLLDNAMKYGGTSALVDVSWERQGGRIAFRVRDHGPGVAPEEARPYLRALRPRPCSSRGEGARYGHRACPREEDRHRSWRRRGGRGGARIGQRVHDLAPHCRGPEPMTRILLVEDEPLIASALQYDLSLEGSTSRWLPTAWKPRFARGTSRTI